VEGGAFGSPPPEEEELCTVIVTGHECGKVVLWDACTPVLRKVCTVLGKGKVRKTGRFHLKKEARAKCRATREGLETFSVQQEFSMGWRKSR
jgi:hypothetical protein